MIGVAHLWIAAYGRAAVVLLASLALGYPLLRGRVRGPAAPVLMLFGGLVAMGLAVSLLAWLHVFTRPTVGVLVLAGLTWSLSCLRRDLPDVRRALSERSCWAPVPFYCMVLLTVALGLLSLMALYPATAFDAPSYHLPLAHDLVVHHGLHYDPFVRYSFFPQANEAMFAVVMLISSSAPACAALEFCVVAAGALLLPLWFAGSGRSLVSGFLAALVLLASPVLIYAGTAAFVDGWTMTFVLAGLLVGIRIVETRSHDWLSVVLFGALLGEAAATKYTGIAFDACVAVGVLLAAGWAPLLWRQLAVAAGALLAVSLPWYLWTIHTTGDPVYPFATSLFGNRHGLWTTSELSAQLPASRGIPQAGVSAIVSRDLQYLRGEVYYNTGANRSPLSWLLGSGLWGVLIASVRRDRAFRAALAAGVLGVLGSIFASADPRYLIPAIGPLAVCAGLVAEHVIGWARSRWHLPAAAASVLAGALVVAALWTSGGYALEFRSMSGNPPSTVAATQRYLAAHIPCYAAVDYLNGRDPAGYRAWGYSCEQARYYAHGVLISDAFSTGSRDRVFDEAGAVLPPDRVLWRRLTSLGVSWVILPTQFVPDPAVLGQHRLFAYVAEVGPELVFRLRSTPPTPAPRN